jgi:hypothetical protein
MELRACPSVEGISVPMFVCKMHWLNSGAVAAVRKAEIGRWNKQICTALWTMARVGTNVFV